MQFNWTKLRLRTTLTILTGVVCTTIALAASASDPERGRETFEKRCTGCHTLDKANSAPRFVACTAARRERTDGFPTPTP